LGTNGNCDGREFICRSVGALLPFFVLADVGVWLLVSLSLPGLYQHARRGIPRYELQQNHRDLTIIVCFITTLDGMTVVVHGSALCVDSLRESCVSDCFNTRTVIATHLAYSQYAENHLDQVML
jgi:hypothetical protein